MAKRVSKHAAKRELEARQWASKKPWDPLDALTGPDGTPIPWQVKFFQDKSRFRALCGTRQGGKTNIDAVEGIDACIETPKTESIFVDITVDHAIEVLFPELQRLLDKYQIDATLRDDHLAFRNGSVYHAMGLSTVAEAKKLQGHRFKLGIFDEMTDLASNIDEAIAMIAPALARHEGRLVAQGIPGPVLSGVWYEICQGNQSHMYSQHRCSILDNPWIPNAQAEIDREMLRLGSDNPLFLRHWRGIWVDDPEARVYRYKPAINSYRGDPPKCRFYVIGNDPAGVRDRDASVVLGFGNGDGLIWHVDEKVVHTNRVIELSGEDNFDWSATAQAIGPLYEKYKPIRMFYSFGSEKKGQQLVYKADHLLHLEAQPFKNLDIEIPRANQLFQSRRLMIREGSDLHNDLLRLAWNDKARALGKNKYASGPSPDVCDAMRAALLAVEATQPDPIAMPLTDAEREQAEIDKLFTAPKKYRQNEPGRVNPYAKDRRG